MIGGSGYQPTHKGVEYIKEHVAKGDDNDNHCKT